jgi:presenilin-like A22 family membrane protease
MLKKTAFVSGVSWFAALVATSLTGASIGVLPAVVLLAVIGASNIVAVKVANDDVG